MNCYFWGYFCKHYSINTTQKTLHKTKNTIQKISRKQKKITKSLPKSQEIPQISSATLAQAQKSKVGFLSLF